MVYGDIVCFKCKKDTISFIGLTEDKHNLNFVCHFCKIFFEVEDTGGYLPSKTRILEEKYPPREGISFS